MNPQRPTTLRLMVEHCPKAVDHYEQGTPYDRRIFATGTAAHDVLQALATKGPSAVEPTVVALMATGREGTDAEPPLDPDAVLEGRDLAVAYAEQAGGFQDEGAWYELGLAFRDDWSPVFYGSKDAWFRCRLDKLAVIASDDEDTYALGLVVSDYKSSWRADRSLLDSIQIKAQAVAAWVMWKRFTGPEAPAFIRREVVNLRTGQVFNEDLWLDDEGLATIEGWQRDIELLVMAANAKPRIARPGVGCTGCPFVLNCDGAAEWFGHPPDESTVEDAAIRFAVLDAAAKAAGAIARQATAEQHVEIEGGWVGYEAKPKSVPIEGVETALWKYWVDGVNQIDFSTAATARGLLASMKLGAAQVRAAIERDGDPDEQRAAIEAMITTENQRRFGAHRTTAPPRPKFKLPATLAEAMAIEQPIAPPPQPTGRHTVKVTVNLDGFNPDDDIEINLKAAGKPAVVGPIVVKAVDRGVVVGDLIALDPAAQAAKPMRGETAHVVFLDEPVDASAEYRAKVDAGAAMLKEAHVMPATPKELAEKCRDLEEKLGGPQADLRNKCGVHRKNKIIARYSRAKLLALRDELQARIDERATDAPTGTVTPEMVKAILPMIDGRDDAGASVFATLTSHLEAGLVGKPGPHEQHVAGLYAVATDLRDLPGETLIPQGLRDRLDEMGALAPEPPPDAANDDEDASTPDEPSPL